VHNMLTMMVRTYLSMNHEYLRARSSVSDTAGESSQLRNNLQFRI